MIALRKNVLTGAMLASLTLPLLAACGGTTTGESPTPGSNPPAATAPAASQPNTATAAPGAEPTKETMAEPTKAADTGAAPAAASGATAGASGDITKIGVEDGAEITIVVNGNPTEQKLYQDGVARFQQIFPNVKVTVNVNNDNYETNMKASFAAQTAPDVFLLPPQLMGAFAPEGLLLPLDESLTAAGASAGDYQDVLIQLFQQDGKTYGLPKDFSPLVVFVNDAMAQEAGVDAASVKTWDQLKEAAQKMTKGDGPGKTYGMCLNPDIQRYGASILQTGNPVIESNKAVFNDERGVNAINFWYSFKEAGTGELYKEMGKNWCGEAFASKASAMAVEGSWIVPFMKDPANNATDMKYTAIPLPIPEGGQQATWVFTNAFGVNANTKFPKAAAALAIYMTSAQNQAQLIPTGLAQPSLKALESDPYYSTDPVAKVLVEQGKSGKSVDLTFGGPTRVGDVVSKMNQAIEAIFLGQLSTQDALDTAAQEVDGVLQQ